MIALTSEYFWYTTRATGMVTLILFTLVVTLGTLVANRVGGEYVGRFEINEIHRSLSMVAVIFLVIHILSTVLDSYVSTGLVSAVIPFTSQYRRLDVALGTIAFDLILAVWVSSLLKARIANTSWRFIHWFSWIAFATAIVHSFLTGTDSHHLWGYIVIGTCLGVVALAALWRFLGRPSRAAGRTAYSPLSNAAPTPRPSSQRTPPRNSSGRR